MGNDGGYIARRSEMVKQKAKEAVTDYISINRMRAKLCAISNKNLKIPIVACKMGYLYSKETVLEFLVKKTVPKTFRHINKIKDIKDVSILENQNQEYPFSCPLTREPHNGTNKFILIWECGCMMSEEAYQTCVNEGKCPVCQTVHKKSDVIQLWEDAESFETKKQLMKELKQKKKEAKLKKNEEQSLLQKRDPNQQYLPEDSIPVKKMASHGNILDGLVQEGYNESLFKSLFHKVHEVEDAKGLMFRNVKFGTR